MFAGRRFALIASAAAVVWFVCILAFWALQPLSDSVPVGVDYTLSTPANVSVEVDCNTLFDSAPRPDEPLPTLATQPAGKFPLGFQREPCVLVHDQARIVFALDTVAFAAVMGGLGFVLLRGRRSPRPAADTSSHLMPVG
jgi:hypothetical protein